MSRPGTSDARPNPAAGTPDGVPPGQPGPRPLLIVVSAPSGAGKSTLCAQLRSAYPGLAYSVSCTTRPPRGRERDGVQYHFLSQEEFAARVARGEFLEHALVHGHRYGTLRREVDAAIGSGRSLLMDIDVQGAAQIRSGLALRPAGDPVRDGFVDVFIAPPSIEALRTRLERRGEDSAQTIERRLANAAAEMAHAHEYRYVVVNDDVETAVRTLRSILEDESRSRLSARPIVLP